MNAEDILAKFGTQQKAAEFFGVHQTTIGRWSKKGVPVDKQMEAEHRTKGELTAEIPWRNL